MKLNIVIVSVFTSGAFILYLLLVFAGKSPIIFPKLFLVKLDFTNLKNSDITPKGDNGLSSTIGGWINDVAGSVEEAASNIIGLPDYYLLYLLGSCTITQNHTSCTSWSFRFSPFSNIMPLQIQKLVNINFKILVRFWHTLVVLSLAGMVTAGVALLTRVFTFSRKFNNRILMV